MKNTSRGWIFDQIQSIANDLSIVNHLTEAIYATEKDIEDVEIVQSTDNDIEGLIQLKNDYIQLLKLTLDNRRDKMNSIKNASPEYNKRMWCTLKHAIESYMESMEVWQATFSDEHYSQMNKSMDILSGAISLFIGSELELCGRCLSDSMKNA